MDEIDLGIVIVSYRSVDAVLRCLDGLAPGGTGPLRLEIHVVDNASGDGTVEAIRGRHPHVQLTALDTNRGFSVASNLGLSRARGRHLALLNPDVRVDPTTLRGMVDLLDAHPEIGVLCPRLTQPGGQAQGVCGMIPDRRAILLRSLGIAGLAYRHGPLAGDERLPYFLFPQQARDVDLVVGAFLVIRREVIERVGLLDESYFLYGEDMDWCRRARALGVRIHHDPSFAAIHEQGSSASSDPLAALDHFHRSALHYHRVHEAPGLPFWLRLLAEISLRARHGLGRLRHGLRLGSSHRVYLKLEPEMRGSP